MTPLEVMAKANYEAWHTHASWLVPWESVPEGVKIDIIGDMRAALLALSTMDVDNECTFETVIRAIAEQTTVEDIMQRDTEKEMAERLARWEGRK